MREPLIASAGYFEFAGITPACAGTTSTHRGWLSGSGDHPRVCGNHFILPNKYDGVAGSPPRVREPPNSCEMAAGRFRITPACAGTTPQYNR